MSLKRADSSGTDTENEPAYVALVNHVLSQCDIDRSVESLEECTPSMFVAIFESMFGVRLRGIVRTPQGLEDHIHNCQLVIDRIGDDILRMDLSHVKGKDICLGHKNSIKNLVEIFSELAAIFAERRAEWYEAEAERSMILNESANKEEKGGSKSKGRKKDKNMDMMDVDAKDEKTAGKPLMELDLESENATIALPDGRDGRKDPVQRKRGAKSHKQKQKAKASAAAGGGLKMKPVLATRTIRTGGSHGEKRRVKVGSSTEPTESLTMSSSSRKRQDHAATEEDEDMKIPPSKRREMSGDIQYGQLQMSAVDPNSNPEDVGYERLPSSSGSATATESDSQTETDTESEGEGEDRIDLDLSKLVVDDYQGGDKGRGTVENGKKMKRDKRDGRHDYMGMGDSPVPETEEDEIFKKVPRVSRKQLQILRRGRQRAQKDDAAAIRRKKHDIEQAMDRTERIRKIMLDDAEAEKKRHTVVKRKQKKAFSLQRNREKAREIVRLRALKDKEEREKKARQIRRADVEDAMYRHVFEDLLKQHRVQANDERRAAREELASVEKERLRRQEAIESCFADQFQVLREQVMEERKERSLTIQAQRIALAKMERDLRDKLQSELAREQLRLRSEDDAFYFKVMSPDQDASVSSARTPGKRMVVAKRPKSGKKPLTVPRAPTLGRAPPLPHQEAYRFKGGAVARRQRHKKERV